jgi:hypothetical protein
MSAVFTHKQPHRCLHKSLFCDQHDDFGEWGGPSRKTNWNGDKKAEMAVVGLMGLLFYNAMLQQQRVWSHAPSIANWCFLGTFTIGTVMAV